MYRHDQQYRWPHAVTTGSFGMSRQMLQSKGVAVSRSRAAVSLSVSAGADVEAEGSPEEDAAAGGGGLLGSGEVVGAGSSEEGVTWRWRREVDILGKRSNVAWVRGGFDVVGWRGGGLWVS